MSVLEPGKPITDDDRFKIRYTPRKLYVNPNNNGALASIADEFTEDGDDFIGEVSVNLRTRLHLSMFYEEKHSDWNSFKIKKLQYHNRFGWKVVGEIRLSHFGMRSISRFIEIISNIDFKGAEKARIDLGDVSLSALESVLKTSQGHEAVKQLSESPELEHDIIALCAKRRALAHFEELLRADGTTEPTWQAFFEANPWVFGYGLTFMFFTPVAPSGKLETVTTGSTVDRLGKRADGLLESKAAISQCTLVEIKRSDTQLLRRTSYRPGCWGVSDELSQAVTQAQKTTFEFAHDRIKVPRKDAEGFEIGDPRYVVQPRSYLVVGNQAQLIGNDDQITCFELYRRNLQTPEIITFDELLERARWIVERLDHAAD